MFMVFWVLLHWTEWWNNQNCLDLKNFYIKFICPTYFSKWRIPINVWAYEDLAKRITPLQRTTVLITCWEVCVCQCYVNTVRHSMPSCLDLFFFLQSFKILIFSWRSVTYSKLFKNSHSLMDISVSFHCTFSPLVYFLYFIYMYVCVVY